MDFFFWTIIRLPRDQPTTLKQMRENIQEGLEKINSNIEIYQKNYLSLVDRCHFRMEQDEKFEYLYDLSRLRIYNADILALQCF